MGTSHLMTVNKNNNTNDCKHEFIDGNYWIGSKLLFTAVTIDSLICLLSCFVYAPLKAFLDQYNKGI